MCHYITVILSGVFDLDEVNYRAHRYSIVLTETTNRYIAQYLKSDETYLVDSYGHCACGTSLCQYGNESQRIDAENRNLERERAKRLKSGWSETKIARWTAQKKHNIERYSGNLHEAKPATDCQTWAGFGKELFEKTGVIRFGILVHFYSGAVSTEKAANARMVLSSKKLTAETLFRMKEDTIMIFARN